MNSRCNRWVFVRNPNIYFDRDCPFCTWSASSFSRNPLNFLTHGTWVKLWYHANFQPFQSSFCSAFQFQGHLAQKIGKCMKNSKWSQKGLKIDDVALNGAYWTHIKSGVEISFKKWNAFVTDEFTSKTLTYTSKEIVHFVHEVHPVFVVTLSTF